MTLIEYNESCEHKEPIKSHGFIVCRECGLVLERIAVATEVINSDNRNFNFFTKQYSEIMLPFNPGTTIQKLQDHNKKPVDTKWIQLKRSQIHFTKTSFMRSNEKSLFLLKRICSNLDLTTQSKKLALYYYRKIRSEEGKNKNPSKRVNGPNMMICSVFFVIRKHHPYIKRETFLSLLRDLGCERHIKPLNKTFRKYYHHFPKLNHTQPEDYLANVIDKLLIDGFFKKNVLILPKHDLRGLCTKMSYNILQCISSQNKSGKRPLTIVATAIYLLKNVIPGLKLTQKQVAQAADICEVSLRNSIPLFDKKKIKALGVSI